MTRALVFETPGLLDLRALTVMGLSAKPEAKNPIGFFGTGLKYAIAVLARLGTPPAIYVGNNRFSFNVVRDEFRGADVELIELVGPHDDRRELPYTTTLGRTWEPWMVYRELEANTRDEGGRTFVIDQVADPSDDRDHVGRYWRFNEASSPRTFIVVESEALVACHEARDAIFLPGATRERGAAYSDPYVEVFDAPSSHLYYRGMRVYDLPKPAIRTYNLLVEMVLTEDRTLKEPHMAEYYLGKHLAELGQGETKLVLDLIHAGPETFEHALRFSEFVAPSDAVVEAVASAVTAQPALAATAIGRYVGSSLLKRQPKVDPFERWPRPWEVRGSGVFDVNSNQILAATRLGNEAMLDLVVAAVNVGAPADDEIPF